MPFQSPPHRGTYCDEIVMSFMVTGKSSFNPLHIGAPTAIGPDRDRHHRNHCFNPLRIGAPTATLVKTNSSLQGSFGFQSPPHRGTYCNSRSWRSSLTCVVFQSPPHRGTYFDGRDVLIEAAARVSIPSASGHLFRCSIYLVQSIS